MKNTSKFLALLLMAAITLTSCKDNKKTSDKDDKEDKVMFDSPTLDAKRIAQIQCKLTELLKDDGYKTNQEEIKKLRRESEDIRDKYEKKRKEMTESDKLDVEKKMRRAYEDELEKCRSK